MIDIGTECGRSRRGIYGMPDGLFSETIKKLRIQQE